MKNIIGILCLAGLIVLAPACSKSGGSAAPAKRNNVNVSEAVAAFNGYRLAGSQNFPKVTAWVWNDALSDEAYKFAQDIAAQGDGANNNIYQTAKGVDMFAYAPTANFALCFLYPDDADVKTMIDNTFKDVNLQAVVQQLMDPSLHSFGMGEYHNRWYLFASKK